MPVSPGYRGPGLTRDGECITDITPGIATIAPKTTNGQAPSPSKAGLGYSPRRDASDTHPSVRNGIETAAAARDHRPRPSTIPAKNTTSAPITAGVITGHIPSITPSTAPLPRATRNPVHGDHR